MKALTKLALAALSAASGLAGCSEQSADSRHVGICLRLLDCSIRFFVYLFRWKIDLGGLIDEQKLRNRAVVLRGKKVQCQQCREVVGQVVLTTAGPAHGNRTIWTVENDGEMF